MMRWIVETSLRLRVAIVVLTIVLLIAGYKIVSQTHFHEIVC